MRAACHAQMYTMGTVLRHGSDAQKQKYLPAIADGSLRLQAFGVTEPGSGTDTTALKNFTAQLLDDKYIVNGQKIWTSRAEYSDLMLLLCRTTPRDQVSKKNRGLVGVTCRHACENLDKSTYHTSDSHYDESCHHRSIL